MTLLLFTNPQTGDTYTWPVNPDENTEQALAKVRQIDRTSNTANVGAVRQQGDDGSLTLDWSVTVDSDEMELALWQWYVLCKSQTIYVTDWNGEKYEGQIIMLSRTRQNTFPPSAVYEIQFEIYTLLSGVLRTAGVVT